jgi:hypothetical protein
MEGEVIRLFLLLLGLVESAADEQLAQEPGGPRRDMTVGLNAKPQSPVADQAIASGWRPDPSANPLRKHDDDPLRAADVAEPVTVFVALHPTNKLRAAGLQTGLAGRGTSSVRAVHGRPKSPASRGPRGLPIVRRRPHTAAVSLWPVTRDNPGEMGGRVASPIFVGRVEELELLEAARRRAADADPAVVLVGAKPASARRAWPPS